MRNIYILKTNIINSLNKVVRFLSSIAIIVFVLTLVISIVLCLKSSIYYFEIWQRNLFIIITFIPIFIYLFVYYLYENIYPLWKTSITLVIKSIVLILFFLIPSILVTYRFDNITKYVCLITILPLLDFILSIFNVDSKTTLNKYLCIYNDIKFILFDFWSNDNRVIRKEHFNNNIQNDREEYYSNEETLGVFQETLSCPLIEAIEVANQITFNAKDISILDIGGYDGVFTSNLVANLAKKGFTFKDLFVVDPLVKKTQYTNQLKAFVSSDSIKFYNENFENWSLNYTKKFNLVIASHSLYSIIDNNSITINQILEKLNDRLKREDGEIVIILANKSSRAYSYKEYVFNTTYGKKITDINAMDFYKKIKPFTNQLQLVTSEQVVDCFIDVSNILGTNTEGKEKLKKWLSYFVRINKINDEQYLVLKRSLLNCYSQHFYELPEILIKYFKDNYDKNIDYEKKILLHKTTVIRLKPS